MLRTTIATRNDVCKKCKTKIKKSLNAPPELQGLKDQVRHAAREYAHVVRPWPVQEAFLLITRPHGIDPEKYSHRFPEDKSQRARTRVLAIAAELHDYLPDKFCAHLGNKWFRTEVTFKLIHDWLRSL